MFIFFHFIVHTNCAIYGKLFSKAKVVIIKRWEVFCVLIVICNSKTLKYTVWILWFAEVRNPILDKVLHDKSRNVIVSYRSYEHLNCDAVLFEYEWDNPDSYRLHMGCISHLFL